MDIKLVRGPHFINVCPMSIFYLLSWPNYGLFKVKNAEPLFYWGALEPLSRTMEPVCLPATGFGHPLYQNRVYVIQTFTPRTLFLEWPH